MIKAEMFLLYPGTAVGCYFLKGGLLKLLHHLPPPFPLLLLHTNTVN